jgi:alkanesulfonate monooxygenase SsuD/methylene tetrahydromethanopterin reductase-like flavin-dependent oxidoreductase (luciferase family)
VPLRNVAITAMEIATLHRLFPSRVDVGVGHGVQDWMAQVGAGADSPMTLLREYLAALPALLRGERVTVAGHYVRLDGVALNWPPALAPAVLAGATGPRSLQLSGEAADGTILTAATPPDGVRHARRLIDEGRRAGRGEQVQDQRVVIGAGRWRTGRSWGTGWRRSRSVAGEVPGPRPLDEQRVAA